MKWDIKQTTFNYVYYLYLYVIAVKMIFFYKLFLHGYIFLCKTSNPNSNVTHTPPPPGGGMIEKSALLLWEDIEEVL